MKRPDIDPKQIPEIRAFLAQLEPADELAYRMALRGMFRRCRGAEWTARIDVLRSELVTSTDDAAHFARLANAMGDRITAIVAALKVPP